MANTALNRTTVALLTNKSGGDLNYGDVVVLDGSTASSFTTTTTQGLATDLIGVILEPNGIASNASGLVALGGYVPKVNLDGAATLGDYLLTDTVAGQGTPSSTLAVGAFGQTLEASAAPQALLWGGLPSQAAASGASTALDNLASVAINTSLLSDTDVTDDLGSLSKNWLAGYIKTLVMAEQAAAPADNAGFGQLWVKSDTPNTLWFTDDAGTDAQLGVGGNPGLVPLEQHTASASASLDFTTSISATYDEYVIELINVIPATDAALLYMRMSTNGGSSYDSTGIYRWTGWRWLSGGSGTTGGNAQSQITCVIAIDTTAGANWSLNGTIRLFNPGGSIYKLVVGQFADYDNAGNALVGTGMVGSYDNTTAVNAFQFLMSTGNIASGTIRAYGVRKS